MKKLSFFLGIFFTFFATFVLSYISMATMIGPWIAPTIVLLSAVFLRFKRFHDNDEKNRELSLIQTAGSVGGIVATAVGFTLPTLYFLNKPQFESLIAHPLYFFSLIGLTCLAGGSLGILIGKTLKAKFVDQEDLPHPISQLVYKTITAQNQEKQTRQLFAGISLSGLICFFRDIFHFGKNLFIAPSIFGSHLPILIMPMLVSIGFIAGTKIIFPLLVGMLSKYLVLYPLSIHANYLPFKLFPVLSEEIFSMAFCSGLILADFLPLLLQSPATILNYIKRYSGILSLKKLHRFRDLFDATKTAYLELFSFALVALVLFHLKFPISSFFVIIPLTIIAAYNTTSIGCRIGLAQIGRFVSLVMIPTMLFFSLTPIQITFLCVLAGCCISTSTDVMFNYKIGALCGIHEKQIRRFQWLGLIVTALSIGFFLWLLFTNLKLGTSELFAQRGKARALLIQSFSFDWIILLFGLFYGLILKKLKISPSMVLGGILMPNGLTLGLVFGAIGTLFVKERQPHFPFFSGILAGESIWFIINVFLQMQ